MIEVVPITSPSGFSVVALIIVYIIMILVLMLHMYRWLCNRIKMCVVVIVKYGEKFSSGYTCDVVAGVVGNAEPPVGVHGTSMKSRWYLLLKMWPRFIL